MIVDLIVAHQQQSANRRAVDALRGFSLAAVWGQLTSDVPCAVAILGRILHHGEVAQITGKNYDGRNPTKIQTIPKRPRGHEPKNKNGKRNQLTSFSLLGIEAAPVDVEVDISPGAMPKTILVGLAEAAVRVSTHRIERELVAVVPTAGFPASFVGVCRICGIPFWPLMGLLSCFLNSWIRHLFSFLHPNTTFNNITRSFSIDLCGNWASLI